MCQQLYYTNLFDHLKTEHNVTSVQQRKQIVEKTWRNQNEERSSPKSQATLIKKDVTIFLNIHTLIHIFLIDR